MRTYSYKLKNNGSSLPITLQLLRSGPFFRSAFIERAGFYHRPYCLSSPFRDQIADVYLFDIGPSDRQVNVLTLVSDATSVSIRLSLIFPSLGEIMLVSQCGLDYTPLPPTVKRYILKIYGHFASSSIQLSSNLNDLYHLLIRQKYSKI